MALEKFYWGVATSSCQIEGAYKEDGKVLSIWDVAEKHIKNNENPYISCDFYHNYKSDIALMKSIGVNAYRFSISWCRVINEKGEVNQKGLDFYNAVIDELIKNNIEPFVTLYHWDLPLWIYNLGGWESEKIIHLFEKYAEVCAEAFGDRVTYWYVFNEPQEFINSGHFWGTAAPFHKNFDKAALITKTAMKAHKKAVEAIRKYSKNKAKIGSASATSVVLPKSNNKEDIERAIKETFEGEGKLYNGLFNDPVFGNRPVKLDDGQEINKEDLKDIYTPLDFIGINYYAPSQGKDYVPIRERKTAMGWTIDERGMYWVNKIYYERFKLPIIVSENGTAEPDRVENNQVHDKYRIEYLQNHINYMLKAKNDGVDIFGYLYWSFVDNFEWCNGYTPRFGLVYIDYSNQKRILKDSGLEYKKIIEKKLV